MIFDRAVNRIRDATETEGTRKELLLTDPTGWRNPDLGNITAPSGAMKVAAVSACIEIRSDSMGKLPIFLMDGQTKERKDKHRLNYLLQVRPNPDMTPYVFKKLIEAQRLIKGNAYIMIFRDPRSARPQMLWPLDPDMVTPAYDKQRQLWYLYTDPENGLRRKIPADDVIHFKGFSDDGIIGSSVLQRAAETVNAAREQQKYESRFYGKNATPSGILSVEADLKRESKEKVRDEWESIYGGVDNSFRVAILDNGLQYKQMAISQRDAQFVESKDIGIADIARFFLVPLYKLQAGKQTYQSNEQNAIEYVVTAIHPTVTQWEEELSYKLLFDSELKRGLEVKINMNAELRGDTESRVRWYKGMRDVGAYNVNEVRSYEDLPDVEGGDLRIAPLNSIPLEQMGIYFDHLMSNGKYANQGGDPTN